MSAALAALLAATSLHLGFQLTVTLVVYPALAEAPDWETAHPRHTRRITPVVVLVYGAVAVTGLWALGAGRSEGWVLISVGGAALAGLTTALVAGPAHARLARGRDDRLLARLLTADRVRTAGALVAVGGAVAAALAAG